jgi:UPF0716 protein FxsA
MPIVLFVVFIVVPLVELFVIIQVGRVVGTPVTLVALLAISIGGAVLVKREGIRAWSRFRGAVQRAKLPAEEVTDGALVLLAGALLLTPGFVTDGIGFLLLVPASRAVVNRAVRSRVRWSVGLGPVPGGRGADRPADDGDLEVDVVDVRRTEPDRRGELDG